MSDGLSPPRSVEAEEAVLGAMLVWPDSIADAAEHLDEDSFWVPGHRAVYAAVLHLWSTGGTVDAVTVAARLDATGQTAVSGGTERLLALEASVQSVRSVADHARVVADMALLRRLLNASRHIAGLAMTGGTDPAAALDEAERIVFDVSRRRGEGSTVGVRTMLAETVDRLELLEQGGPPPGLMTGWHDLDAILSGIDRSAFVVIGGRPATGKTALALGLASNAALKGEKALLFSLEMSRAELSGRMLAADARVDATHMKKGRLSDEEWAKVTRSISRLAKAPLWVDDNPHTTVAEVRAKARRLAAQEGQLGVIVVDYLQLMHGRANAETRQVEIAEISRSLKVLARELETPVIGLSQLSRGVESRGDKRPMLADLRESGAIEQDADIVMFVYRDELYDPDSHDKGMAEIIVSKHRNGPVGTARLAYMPQWTLFADMART